MPSNGKLIINNGSENLAQFISNGTVELYYDNVKTFHTKQNGVVVEGTEGAGAILEIRADEGDDNNDYFRFFADPSSSNLYVQNYASGSWETNARFIGNGTTELWYDNSKKFETTSAGATITGSLGIGTTSPAELLHLQSTAGNTKLRLTQSGSTTDAVNGAIHFGNSTSGQLTEIRGYTSGSANSGYLQFRTSNSGSSVNAMEINSTGRVDATT